MACRCLPPLACFSRHAYGAGTRQLPPLSFLGFEAGASLTAVGQQVAVLGGRALRCERATPDRALLSAAASVVIPGARRVVDLWLSAIDSATGC